jgi:hypothetical protein
VNATERARLLVLCLLLSGCVATPAPRCRAGERLAWITYDAGRHYYCARADDDR